MKIALPSRGQQVDGHFGHCESFTVFTVASDRKIAADETVQSPAGCGCKSNVIPQRADMGVEVMLAGNMGDGAVRMLGAHGITVVRGCSGEVRQVVVDWLDNRIQDSGTGCTLHGADGCPGH